MYQCYTFKSREYFEKFRDRTKINSEIIDFYKLTHTSQIVMLRCEPINGSEYIEYCINGDVERCGEKLWDDSYQRMIILQSEINTYFRIVENDELEFAIDARKLNYFEKRTVIQRFEKLGIHYNDSLQKLDNVRYFIRKKQSHCKAVKMFPNLGNTILGNAMLNIDDLYRLTDANNKFAKTKQFTHQIFVELTREQINKMTVLDVLDEIDRGNFYVGKDRTLAKSIQAVLNASIVYLKNSIQVKKVKPEDYLSLTVNELQELIDSRQFYAQSNDQELFGVLTLQTFFQFSGNLFLRE